MFDLPSSRPSSALPRSSFKSTRSLTTVANKLGSAVKLGALSRMLNSMDEDADGVLVLLGRGRCVGVVGTRTVCWCCWDADGVLVLLGRGRCVGVVGTRVVRL